VNRVVKYGVCVAALCALFSLSCGLSRRYPHGYGRPGAYREVGEASYYAREAHGKTTASGETFNMYALTAAHKTLPFGTRVRVTNLANKRSVVVRINDRGPFAAGRIIDLSYAAAKKIKMLDAGVADVEVVLVD
jgi:rare lipoprotein A